MRYVIIGAGSIGGALAARLARHSPNPPVLVARGARAAALRDRGIRLRTPDEDVTVPVAVVEAPDEAALRDDDVLVLTTKTQQADEALRTWADAPVHDAGGTVIGTAGDLLPVCTALNGVESERIALRYFERVYGVCVWLPAVSLDPAEVVVSIAPTIGILTIGAYPARPVDDDRVVAAFAADFRASGVDVYPEADVMGWKYQKLLSNLANGLQALLGPDGASWRDLASALREEALGVYAAAGVQAVSDATEKARRGDTFRSRPVPGVEHELGGSSWQSLVRGSGSIETDYLNGEIALLARSAGTHAPRNALVQHLARVAARDHLQPGAVTPDEIRSRFATLAAGVAA
ncbi:2-dehydropantoate 2-reductase N-terminal domain-containing protein [Curtobacterium sp. MCBD17_040]|uniref:ketopantoate reductase family protein n=1 Tax=Curtobacterium sp. MCBD17_040 TaxID=2175674 RepID=UPI000DA9B3BF|nr:2-dehydropantoate 2-reductase N-terminal domain-containing protein [Curtobacterium sp. MCBD17_040]WIB64215.1 2-dehydropantoate 2-reductase N-terminal domain-containing protein [Curtobacterium sp. MCBD17_040]